MNTQFRSYKALYILGFLALALGMVFSGPLQNAQGQEEGPNIPPPPRLEPYPVERDIDALGIQSSISAPDASGVSSNTLGAGDNTIHGMVFYNGYLYASTRSTPVGSTARIFKIDPTSLSVVGRASPFPANLVDAEDIIEANGYIWSIATNVNSTVGRLIRVDPVSMATNITTLVLPNGDFLPYPESLVYAFGKLWAGGYDKIAEIDITTTPPTFDLHDFTGIISNDYVLNTALSSDSTHIWAMFLQGITSPPSYSGTTLLRIDPTNPTVGYLRDDFTSIFPDDMVNTDAYLYTSTEDVGQPSDVYRFPETLTPFITETMSSSESYGVFHSHTDLQNLWGAYVGAPGIITQFDINLIQEWSFTLPTGYNNPAEIAFDGSGNMYIATFQAPAGIVKYTIPDPVTLSISRSGGDAVLNWTNSDPLVDHYEVWRSTFRNFLPWDAGAAKLADVAATVGAMTYTDLGAITNTATDYFYRVRAYNDFGLFSAASNQVGEINRPLTTGWNLIALPLAPSPSLLAETMLVEALGQGANCPEIDNWIGASWQAHFRGLPFNNFNMSNGQGFFVRCTASGNWTMVGNVPTGSTPIPLGLGWNLIGIPYPPGAYVAQTVLDGIESQGGICPEIDNWIGASWQAHFDGFPFNNFAVEIKNGYFARCTTATTWTP